MHPGAGCPIPSTREGGPETPRSAQRALPTPTPHPLRWGSEPAAPWQHNTPLTKFRHGRRGRSGVDWACVCGATGAQNVGPSACQRVCAAAQASQWKPSSTDATLNTYRRPFVQSTFWVGVKCLHDTQQRAGRTEGVLGGTGLQLVDVWGAPRPCQPCVWHSALIERCGL